MWFFGGKKMSAFVWLGTFLAVYIVYDIQQIILAKLAKMI